MIGLMVPSIYGANHQEGWCAQKYLSDNQSTIENGLFPGKI